jgi:hypothetical protein
MATAAMNGAAGDPNDYRNYRLQAIMDENAAAVEQKVANEIIFCR